MSFRNRPLAITCAAVLALTIAACGGHSAKKATPTPTPTTSTASSSPAPLPPAVNPLNGMGKPSANPVVAVKIDDTENGRPQRNIDYANIVYIEQVEGGLTRLLAIYNSTLPVVEAVRSTRASDPELVQQYGPIAYVASGGGGNPLEVLDHSTLKSAINDRGGPGFSRDPNRPAPYNLVSDLSVAGKVLKGPKAKSIGLVWSAAYDLTKAPSAPTVQTTVGSTPVRFDWSAALGRYVRVIDGARQVSADGLPIATPNVIVQFCSVTSYPQDVDVMGNPSQYTHTVGKGKTVVFRNGHRIDGTWSRPTVASGTVFADKAGKPIPLAPGGVWIVLVATNTALYS